MGVVGIARVVELAGVDSIFAQGGACCGVRGCGGGGGASGDGGGGGRGRIGGGSDIRGGRGFGERALEGPSRGLQGRVALNVLSLLFPLRCSFSSSDL